MQLAFLLGCAALEPDWEPGTLLGQGTHVTWLTLEELLSEDVPWGPLNG